MEGNEQGKQGRGWRGCGCWPIIAACLALVLLFLYWVVWEIWPPVGLSILLVIIAIAIILTIREKKIPLRELPKRVRDFLTKWFSGGD